MSTTIATPEIHRQEVRLSGPADGDLPAPDEAGAASAEYAAVTACGVGLAGVLMKLLTSDFGQALLEKLLNFFLGMVGIG